MSATRGRHDSQGVSRAGSRRHPRCRIQLL